MNRHMMTEQFLGLTFINLIKKNQYEIEFSILNRIENIVDKKIREKNNAVLSFSKYEVYSVISGYNYLFQISDNKIRIHQKFEKETKEELTKALNDYFSIGIPNDIEKTVNNLLEEEL